MIRAAVFDIDDTLFDMRTGKFISSAIHGLQILQKRGITVILATGRPPLTAEAVFQEGMIPDYIVCSNGHLILDENGKVLREYSFDKELASDIYQYCREHGIGLLWKYSDKIYEYIHVDIFETFYDKTIDSRKNVVKNETDIHEKKNPNGGCLGCDMQKLEKFNQHFAGRCVAVKINESSSDLMLFGVNKKKAVEELLKHLDISPEQCIAFGDNMNDREILAYAGIGVCVGNGCDDLKKAADYVTDDIQKDGIAHALQHFGLI